MDYETLANCFVGVFTHYKTTEQEVFVVHKLQNDFTALVEFLERNKKQKEWHISYNGLAFDAQVTHYVLEHQERLKELSPDRIASEIYKYAQEIIGRQNRREYQDYPQWEMVIGQIDVFKLHHWDNMAKRSSLKWIQYSMDWDNILDMPIHHETKIETKKELKTIIKYCINDVESTKEIYNRSKSEIGLRKELTEKYGIDLFSASEPKISKELFAYYLSKDLKIPKYELKKLRTYRESIKVSEVILPSIEFKTPEFQLLLDKFNTIELDPAHLKGSFKYSVNYKGMKTNFGLGGAHGATTKGVYESGTDFAILTSDVISFYPNQAIVNQWSPAHLPKKEFCELYKWFFDERKKIPKSNHMNYVYKIILNSTFGLSNEENSFLYDPELLIRITVNGQLSLMMLYEMIMEAIPDAVPLMQNTDSVETMVPRDSIEKYYEICKSWEAITNLRLEHDEYQKMILADVNNYIAVYNYREVDLKSWRELKKKHPHYLFKYENNKFFYAPTKCNGRFEFTNLQLHKNKSKLVVPKGIYAYFVKGMLPSDYIQSNKNILDFCIGGKSKGDWYQVSRYIDIDKLVEDKLQKINRYYVSNKGSKIIKLNSKDQREIQLESGQWLQTVYNKMKTFVRWSKYDIDNRYYIQAIEKEISNIMAESNQLKLF